MLVQPSPGRVIAMPQGEPAGGNNAELMRLVDALSYDSVAALLGVSPESLKQCIAGDRPINASTYRRIADLEFLSTHLLAAFTPEQAVLWIEGQNAHLGARPADVFRLEGSAPLIEAIRAHEQGSAAG